MAEEYKLNDGLSDLESALHDLAPAPARLNTAQTIFLAGQQSVLHRQRWQSVWPASTACLALVCITFGLLLVFEKGDAAFARKDGKQPAGVPAQKRQKTGTETPALPAPTSEKTWRELAIRRQMQRELLADPWIKPQPGSPSEDPAAIEMVTSADWPALLTDESVGERFRMLAEPMCRPPAALEYLSTIFPKRG